MRPEPHPFDDVPRTAGGHFALCLYAAIYRVVYQVHRLSDHGGDPLEKVFERYGFLADYFGELCEHLPDGLTWAEAQPWWRRTLAAWEAECPGRLPLLALDDLGLGFSQRLAFMMVGLIEEDSRFGTLFAELQGPLTHRRPTLELVGQTVRDGNQPGEGDPWVICRPLLRAGLLTTSDPQLPRSEWPLRVPPLIWDAARGQVDARPAKWCRYRRRESLPEIDELVQDETLRDRLSRLPDLVRDGKVRVVVTRSAEPAEPEEILGAVARATGHDLVVTDGEPLADDAEAASLLGPLCTLAHAIPVLRFDLGPGETAEPPELEGYRGPLGLILGEEGGLGERLCEDVLTLTIPLPGPDLRRARWQRALNGRVADLEGVTNGFQIAGGFIDKVARMAVAQAGLEGREKVEVADVRRSTRVLNRQLLDTLASPLAARGTWNQLVAGVTTNEKLRELTGRCRYRERLLGHLGPAFGSSANRGVRSLFTGPSGTGKTLAARILAAELGMDLYRVDLASVINKYIGETEKNLNRVLSRAESLDVLLLLDEGDALLGQRTEVRSANDRYANLETNYLLQRLEGYQGVVVVTTNLGDNIDSAFQRRMDVVVPFLPPQAEERHRILLLHLPDEHAASDETLERVAVRCALTGGQIRNAVQHATLIALEAGAPMSDAHLYEALRAEYRKVGGTFPLEEGPPPSPTNLKSFVAALEAH